MIALARIHTKPLQARSHKKKKHEIKHHIKKLFNNASQQKKKKVLETINLPTVINKKVFKLVAAGLSNGRLPGECFWTTGLTVRVGRFPFIR